MPDQNTDPGLYDIICSVQVHSKTHSKSCKKYSTTYRFNFPRPPIRKTFIARADHVEDQDNKTAKELTIEELDEMSRNSARKPREILKDIWTLVSVAEQDNLSFADILKLSNVTYKQFKQCLIDVAKTNTVYLKRQLPDIWVNNYNPHISRVWNANLDIQYVTDAYVPTSELQQEAGGRKRRCCICHEKNCKCILTKQKSFSTRSSIQSDWITSEGMYKGCCIHSCREQYSENESSN